MESNLNGTFELLEAAREFPPKHMLLASTSSIYGVNENMPYRETDKVDHQISFYAATKKSMENMAHSYAHVYHLPITIFRFFTVYGPWGRPDMAPYLFTKAILNDEPINLFNNGNMQRDFTYINDLVKSIQLLMKIVPNNNAHDKTVISDSLSPCAPWRVVNIGNSKIVSLSEFVDAIEKATNKKSIQNLMPMQLGDVKSTWADNVLLKSLTGFQPSTDIYDGMRYYVKWFREYYNC